MGIIGIYTTNRCNLKCKYCFAEQKKNNLDLNRVYEFIDYYDAMCSEKSHDIIITGGEPLLSEGLKELCNKLSDRFTNVALLTNGVYLTEEWMEYFQDKNIAVHISLDSITSEYHEKYRGHFAETKLAVDRMRKFSNKQIPVICMTLSYENLEQLHPMIEYAKKNNFDLDLNLISLNSTQRLSWNNATEEQIQCAIQGIDEWSSFTNRVVKGILMKKFLLNPFFSLDICFNRTHSLIIRANGDLYPCFMNNTRYFGNIYIDSFEKIIETKRKWDINKRNENCFGMECMGIYD